MGIIERIGILGLCILVGLNMGGLFIRESKDEDVSGKNRECVGWGRGVSLVSGFFTNGISVLVSWFIFFFVILSFSVIFRFFICDD